MGHGKCHLQASLHFQADFDASDEEALPIAVAEKAAEGEPDEPGEPEAAAKEGEAKSASETNEASYSFAVADISRSNLCIFEVLTTFLTCVLFQGWLGKEQLKCAQLHMHRMFHVIWNSRADWNAEQYGYDSNSESNWDGLHRNFSFWPSGAQTAGAANHHL